MHERTGTDRTLKWGNHQMAKKLDVDNNKITILTKGPAVFVMVGEEAFFSIGLDGENYLEIYDIALTEDSLDSAGGLFGE